MKYAHSAIHNFDVEVTRFVQKCPRWLGLVFAFGTWLGTAAVLLIGSALVAIWFYINQNISLAKAFGLAVGGMLIISGLKEIFRRARPDNPYAALQKGFSFPSGHTGHSTVFYGLIASLLHMYIGGPWLIVGILACLLIALCVGRITHLSWCSLPFRRSGGMDTGQLSCIQYF